MTQAKADAILAASKWVENGDVILLPIWMHEEGTRSTRCLILGSPGNEKSLLTIRRTDIPGQLLRKVTFQLRHQTKNVLLRLDFGTEHRNPDGVHLVCPHIHHFLEGDRDEWAETWDGPALRKPSDMSQVALAFLKRAGITAEVEGTLI